MMYNSGLRYILTSLVVTILLQSEFYHAQGQSSAVNMTINISSTIITNTAATTSTIPGIIPTTVTSLPLATASINNTTSSPPNNTVPTKDPGNGITEKATFFLLIACSALFIIIIIILIILVIQMKNLSKKIKK